MKKWNKDIPTKPGYYWFYGELWDKKDIYYIRCRKITNGFMYVTKGAFVYPKRECVGVWQPVIFPELPTD